MLDTGSLGDAPLAVRLLGEDFVLWRDAAGKPRAARDRCPHRGTRLSLGKVCDGQIECAYHGWRFDGEGRCRLIPALPEFVPPASHAVATFAVADAHGLLWLQPEGREPVLPAFPAESDPKLRKLVEQQEALQRQVESHRLQREKMEPAAYEAELERLLTEPGAVARFALDRMSERGRVAAAGRD